MKLRTRLRAAERCQDTARLAAPQVMPMAGDGYAASSVTAPLRGGADSYLRQTRSGGWEQVFIVPTRAALVAARYRDWLFERDNRRVAA